MAPPATDPKKFELDAPETFKITGPEFKLELPLIDHARRIYPKSALIFELPTVVDEERIVTGLKDATQRVVQQIPWLACELKANPEANGLVKGLASGMISKSSWVPSAFKASPEQSIKAKLYHTIVPGPALVMVRRVNPKLVFTALGVDDFTDELFPQVPLKDAKAGTETWPAMAVQAVFSADGYLLLTFAIHHGVADGRSHMDIVRLFSQEFARVTEGGGAAPGPAKMIPGVLDRSRIASLMPAGPVSKATEAAHPAMKVWGATEIMGLVVKMQMSTSKQTILDRRFTFSQSGLAALVPSPNPLNISVHDVACALIWRGTMAARLAQGKITPKTEVGFGMAVCIRRHLPRNKEEPFWGNAISAIHATLPVGQLLAAGSEGLVAGATAIRKAIAKCDLEDARIATALHVSASDLRLVQSREFANLGTSYVYLTSWNSFKVFDMSWGPLLGRFRGVSFPSGGRPEGLMVMLSPFEDGDFNVAVAFEEKNFAELERDEVWKKYATPFGLVR